MTIDYEANEIYIQAAEWVTILLADSTEITVQGDGKVWTDGGREFQARRATESKLIRGRQ